MAKGLPDVIQKFAADNADYLRKLNENYEAVRTFANELETLQRKLQDVQRIQEEYVRSGRAGDEAMVRMERMAVAAEKAVATQAKLTAETKRYYDVLKDFERTSDKSPAAAVESLTTAIRQTASETAITAAKTRQAWSDYHRDANNAVMLVRQLNAENRALASNFGGGGTAAALTALRGGGAGGGAAAAFLADAFGHPSDRGGPLTAAAYADKIVTFAKRWAGAAHYAVMGTMEALSTIVPATVALGAAAAVSIQAGEQLAVRGKATMVTGEALGYPAYGITAGGIAGMGGAFQQAQNRYGGGLYGLTGGLMTLAQMGQGQFLQMGGQTMAMMDRGMAAMVLNARQRGTAQQLQQVLGGGTQYLRQFGDIGANLGDFLLGMAPNLPGVGQLLLGGLTGITGGLAWGARNIPGPLLGAGMAAEAGWRLGTPLLGLAGRGLTGLGGLAGRLGLGTAGASLKDLMKIFPDVSRAELLTSGLIGEGGSGLAGLLGTAGGLLGGLSGPAAAGIALGLWEGSILGRYKTPIGQGIAAQQAAIGNAPFSAAITPLAAALPWAARRLPGGPLAPTIPSELSDPRGFVTRQRQADISNLHQFVQQTQGQLAGWAAAAPQLLPVLEKMGIHGATFADALQIMTASLLDVNHAIDPKTHQLTAPAVQQVTDFVKAITGANIKGGILQPGAGTPAGAVSALMAGLSAQTIMGSPQVKAMATYNQALDSMTQLMTGGMAGQAALFSMLGGTPVTARRGGLQLAAGAGPLTSAFAQALASPFTGGGARAWSTFAGQGGLIPALQQNLDQIRMEQSLGAISAGQGARLSAFDIMQLLPMARNSPAALANLMSMGMQMGIPGMQYFQGSATSGANLARQFAIAQQAIARFAPTAAGATSISNLAAVGMSNLPNVAGQFMQQIAPTMAQMTGGDAIQMAMNLAAQPGDRGSVARIIRDLMAQPGMKPGMLQGTIGAMLGGVGGKMTPQLGNLIAKGIVIWENQHKPLSQQTAKGIVNYENTLKTVQQQKARGVVVYTNNLPPVPHPTTTGTIVWVNTFSGTATFGTLGPGGQLNVSPVKARQTGGLIPGYGGGDIIPAFLEPGEAVVPKHLVSAVAPFLSAHKVPGFAGGRIPEHQVFWAGDNDLAGMPAAARKIIDALLKALQSEPSQLRAFGKQLLESLIDGIKNAHAESTKMAQALVNKVATEVAYARDVATSTLQGLDFAGMQLPAKGSLVQLSQAGPNARGFNATAYNAYVQAFAADTLPGGVNAAAQPKSVQQQMQDYLHSIEAFRKDINMLSKEGLRKDVLKQLISAGPVQGDLLAQSIMGATGGVGAINKLYAQIVQQSNALGITAAQDIFGPISKGKPVKIGVHADASPVHALQAAIDKLHDRTITITVKVVNDKGGGKSAIPPAEMKDIAEQVQKLLLQQGHRNTKTGLQLPGRGI